MPNQNTELHKEISRALDQKVLQIDASTYSALNRVREQALLKAKQPRMFGLFELSLFGSAGRFATAIFSVLFVVGTLITTTNWLDNSQLNNNTNMPIVEKQQDSVPNENTDSLQITTGIDFDALKEGEDLDLFENMDLYQWLDNEFGSA